MKKLFYAGAFLLALFEMANVYFIMPMPYSQRWHSIDLAYALHSWRWLFRAVFGMMILAGDDDLLVRLTVTACFAPVICAVPPS